MKVKNDERVDKVIRLLPLKDSAKITWVADLFIQDGFLLPEKYLKKIMPGLWEFRAGRWRLLFGIIEDEALVVNIFLKKTQKTPRKEIKVALNRLKEYEETS